MQQDIAQHYEISHPGQVQVVGVDEWNGTVPQLRSFKSQTGATYPLLLQGGSATGGNFLTLYGTYDNYVIVDKQGIVRYHAALIWSHGNRYHLNEIRACVDTLVTQATGVEPSLAPDALRLGSAPNPARGGASVELVVPAAGGATARVTVHDLGGRQVAILWDGAVSEGLNRFAWRGQDATGAPLRPGIYLINAQVGARRVVHRAVVLR